MWFRLLLKIDGFLLKTRGLRDPKIIAGPSYLDIANIGAFQNLVTVVKKIIYAFV